MLIGITGYKRSGKTTLANLLSNELGLQVFSYADPIRKAVADILGITLEQLEECKEDPVDWLGGVTPRLMMQTMGTEWGRQMIDPFMWGKSMFRRMPNLQGITADVRFNDEAQALLDRGGIILRVIRPGLATSDTHSSEKQIDQSLINADIYNHGTPEDMLATALRLLA